MKRNDKGEASPAWIIVGAVVVVLVFTVGLWAVSVAVSDTKGRGDSVITKNSSGNRIAAQERFEQLYADIKASDAKIAPAKAAAAASPNSAVAQKELTGIQNYCLDVVSQYTAAARSYTSKDFKAADLPEPSALADDESTDCK